MSINTCIVISERDDGGLNIKMETLGGQGTVREDWNSDAPCEVPDAMKILPEMWVRLKQRKFSNRPE